MCRLLAAFSESHRKEINLGWNWLEAQRQGKRALLIEPPLFFFFLWGATKMVESQIIWSFVGLKTQILYTMLTLDRAGPDGKNNIRKEVWNLGEARFPIVPPKTLWSLIWVEGPLHSLWYTGFHLRSEEEIISGFTTSGHCFKLYLIRGHKIWEWRMVHLLGDRNAQAWLHIQRVRLNTILSFVH